MPLPQDVIDRLARAGQEIRAICQRENLTFVLVAEPKDVPTGVVILSDDDRDDAQSIRDTRETLAAAVRRMEGQHFNLVKAPLGDKP